MLFKYKPHKRKLSLMAAYALSIGIISSAAFAIQGTQHSLPATAHDIPLLSKINI